MSELDALQVSSVSHRMPHRLRKRPCNSQGRPLPYIAQSLPDGSLDPSKVSWSRVKKCVKHRFCSVCGEPFSPFENLHFAGRLDPESLQGVQTPFPDDPIGFERPPAHRACLEYMLENSPDMVLSSTPDVIEVTLVTRYAFSRTKGVFVTAARFIISTTTFQRVNGVYRWQRK